MLLKAKHITGVLAVKVKSNPFVMDRIREQVSNHWFIKQIKLKKFFSARKQTNDQPLCDGSHNV